VAIVQEDVSVRHPSNTGPWSAACLGLSLVLAACTPEAPPKEQEKAQEKVQEAQSPVFLNGDFEGGAAGVPPPSWTIASFVNNPPTGITVQQPQTRAGLNLTLNAGSQLLTATINAPGGAETQTDTTLGAAASLRWPRFGNKCALVNGNATGDNANVNSLTQTMTVANADIDPVDGLAHVRFVVAPVLQNPAHNPSEQPYYFVQLKNISKGNAIVYSDFNLSAQPGVPWKTVGTTYYTDWQLVDIAPGPAQLGLGDQVELEIIAAGCSLGGHWGQVYVDGVATQIPGLFVTGTGPNSANAGTNISYHLTYKNGGAAASGGVKVEFNIPPNTTFQAINPNGLVCVTPPVGAGGLVSCTVGVLGAGASGSFDVTVQINAGTPAGSIITAGNYNISGLTTNPLIGPHINTVVTNGVVFADLSLTKSDGVANVIQGQPVAYTITASNAGPGAVVGASITDNFPAGIINVNWTCVASAGSACGAAAGAGNINTTASILAGGTVTYTATGTVAPNAGGQISNTASIVPPVGVTDPTPANASAADVDNVTPCAGFNAPCSVGVGECASPGVNTCLNNVAVCNAVAKLPVAEICDNKDNDCNGVVDNGNPGANVACNTGLQGVCTAGTTACVAGAIVCNQNVLPSAEICDNLDNDCNGAVNNGNPGGNVACNTGLLGVCSAGTTACVAGAIACNQNAASSAETCDNLDNNCNGSSDEGFNKGAQCSAGVGACAANGVIVCLGNGSAGCSAVPGAPSAEICGNNVDEDCDGVLDNNCPDGDNDGLSDALELVITRTTPTPTTTA
jgi:uncharacterized repeat protein (TIGR01451 family)